LVRRKKAKVKKNQKNQRNLKNQKNRKNPNLEYKILLLQENKLNKMKN
jgi:hypothetical protein